ncbi:hypothetical protein ANOM_005106 [Aspergillus nomiae NRRL 13137]|uniref:Uncharacterized protein n=1 Tax=Aspergillus nomiae NRRL (strain ATCC 15546 / NRRL 13137 / CBS 260.88 / M93) TaxID=1509407 RepID=A0A0L1J5Y3_ASPN3|nr:uncharacterized protein ANOM_005106 [Aspergillus nomiae NRRL 13137]KNG87149.1 hypothetical protein ANOM_005106 [Aspergillus nomiae NRRL 13137]
MEAAGIEIDEHDNGQPYKPEDIVILSDGICSSACALFMELMHHEAGVRTVVIGGQPSYGPMQAPSGTRGAAVYKAENMHQDIDLARDIDNSMHVDLPNRAHAFFITTATVNLRDQVRHTDTSATPLQFLYEAADCRIFFIPETWYNYTNLWKYAADAIWQKPALCAKGSRTNHTQSNHPSVPGKSYNASSTLSNLAASQSDEQPSSIQDKSNFILDKDEPVVTKEGYACQSDYDCSLGVSGACWEVDVCITELRKTTSKQPRGFMKPKKQKRCVTTCTQQNGNRDCSGGRICLNGGYCGVGSALCNGLASQYNSANYFICYGTYDTLTCYDRNWKIVRTMAVEYQMPYSASSPVLYADGIHKCCCGDRNRICMDNSKPPCTPTNNRLVCVCSDNQSCPLNKAN